MSGEEGNTVVSTTGNTDDVRGKLATMLFEVVRLVQELPVGFAFAFKNDPIWTNRINEFIRLEKLAHPEFEFKLEPDQYQASRVWFYWLGEPNAIHSELAVLCPQFNPLGRVTVLREEPLVSVLLTTDADPAAINRLIPHILEQVRSPVEVIVMATNPEAIHRPYEMRRDQRLAVIPRGDSPYQTAIEESQGDVLVFVDALVQPTLLRRMVDYMHDQHLVIGARPDTGEAAPSALTNIANKMAGLVIGGEVQDYLSPILLVRRRSLNELGLEVKSRADFVKLIRGAQKAEMSVIEVSA